jgi:hypothetical protein
MLVALYGHDQRDGQREVAVEESQPHSANAVAAKPAVACWESFKLAVLRARQERAPAVQRPVLRGPA